MNSMGYRQQISALTKKDTGSLQVRDFTDEVYSKKNLGQIFITDSKMFQDVLIVLQRDRIATFPAEMHEIMT